MSKTAEPETSIFAPVGIVMMNLDTDVLIERALSGDPKYVKLLADMAAAAHKNKNLPLSIRLPLRDAALLELASFLFGFDRKASPTAVVETIATAVRELDSGRNLLSGKPVLNGALKEHRVEFRQKLDEVLVWAPANVNGDRGLSESRLFEVFQQWEAVLPEIGVEAGERQQAIWSRRTRGDTPSTVDPEKSFAGDNNGIDHRRSQERPFNGENDQAPARRSSSR